jgi:transporter family-2 protein
MEKVLAIAATLGIGVLIAFQPPANALLAKHVGDLGSAFVSLVISTTIVGILLVAAGQVGDLGGLSSFKPVYLLGGLGSAAVVFGTIITVRELGAGGVVAALVFTQLTVSAVIDRFGWLEVSQISFSTERIVGIVLLLAGTVLVTAQ